GGTVRDMLLGNYPVTWTQHPMYIHLTISAGLLTMLVARYMHRLHAIFLVLDAMGLIAFTVIGCNVALELGYTTTVVIMAGMTTGIFGGILRDILCNRTPMVLRKELYASVSLLVAILYLTLRYLEVNHDLNLIASFVFGLGIRLAAIRWSWSLPVFSYAPGRWNDSPAAASPSRLRQRCTRLRHFRRRRDTQIGRSSWALSARSISGQWRPLSRSSSRFCCAKMRNPGRGRHTRATRQGSSGRAKAVACSRLPSSSRLVMVRMHFSPRQQVYMPSTRSQHTRRYLSPSGSFANRLTLSILLASQAS